MTTASMAERSLGFACPRCRAELAVESDAYECTACDGRYPIVLGIADFRVFPDPWIGLEEDREKARRLEAMSRGASLESMVRAYWSLTQGTPAAQASRFVEHVLGAYERSREWVRLLGAPRIAAGEWLDVGTGTGDLATVAAEQGIPTVGVDIAMRWLVVARRRAELAGVAPRFVCCNAEHLPFANGVFSRVLSVGTIEHCRDVAPVLREAHRVLGRGGEVRLRTVNRYSLLGEPHVGVWGVGYLPRRWADRYVRWRTGQGYEHHRPLSSRELNRGLRGAGFHDVRVDAAPLLSAERARLGPLRLAGGVYERSRHVAPARTVVRWVAPLLEASGVAA